MRVLLVADCPPDPRPLKAGLGRGFSVNAAPSGRDAYARAWQGFYDVILLDLAAPGAAGLVLLREWRAAGLGTPVLALTDPGRPGDRVRCLNGGADDCLARPPAFDELAARLRALVRRCARARGSVLRVGELEIDTVSFTVRRGGRPIYLTPREYALLRLLAAHPGRVVARSMILEALYRGEYQSNIVDVYIRYLRRKIDKGFERPLILTRWGQGYLLRDD
jgi:DNA-binding response OmpR family regulator